MIEGVKLNLNGKYYIVPALNQGGFRRSKNARKTIAKVLAAPEAEREELTDEFLDAVQTVAFEALRRNYPDLEREAMDDLLDARNTNAVLGAVMGTDGTVEPQPGEDAPQRAPSPTGANSMA